MKKLLSIAVFALFGLLGYAQSAQLTVFYEFRNIEEGYDHETKTQVVIDGKSVGESTPHKQSKKGMLTVNVPAGEHKLSVMNWAKYEGVWEEHTVTNNYSIDCMYEESHRFGSKPEKLYLVFDLDSGMQVSWKKPVKGKKGKK
jgi:hypothetical protein